MPLPNGNRVAMIRLKLSTDEALSLLSSSLSNEDGHTGASSSSFSKMAAENTIYSTAYSEESTFVRNVLLYCYIAFITFLKCLMVLCFSQERSSHLLSDYQRELAVFESYAYIGTSFPVTLCLP